MKCSGFELCDAACRTYPFFLILGKPVTTEILSFVLKSNKSNVLDRGQNDF